MKKLSRQSLYNYNFDKDSKTQLSIRTLHGVGWSSLSNIFHQVIRFLVLLFLARFLSPGDFGLVGMATVVIAFFQVFQTGGLGLALIQRKDLTESQVSSTFWAIAFFASCLTVILLTISHYVGMFYENRQVGSILSVLAFAFLFGALSIVPRSLITRSINFKSLFFIDIGATLSGGIISLATAYQGLGVWSLVTGTLVESFCRLVLFWIHNKWMPRMIFEFGSLKPLLPIALPLLATAVVQYFVMNMDQLIVGKFLGPASLGLYTVAYKVILAPLSQVSEAISRVVLPGFSSIQEDKTMVGRGFLKLSRYISFIMFPAMAGLAVVAPEVIRVFLGGKWLPATDVLRILTIVGAIGSIQSIGNLIFLSQGRTDILMKWSLFSTTCYVIGYFAGIPWGINGVACTHAIASLLLAPLYFVITLRLVGINFQSLVISLAPATFGAALIGCVLSGLRATSFIQSTSISLRLFLLVFAGIVIYSAFTILFRRQFVTEIIRYFKAGFTY